MYTLVRALAAVAVLEAACACGLSAQAKADSAAGLAAGAAAARAALRSGETGLEFAVTARMGPEHTASAGYPVINRVAHPSPGAAAGLQSGDVLLEVDGRDARLPGATFFLPGHTYVLRIRRGAEQRELALVPVARPAGKGRR